MAIPSSDPIIVAPTNMPFRADESLDLDALASRNRRALGEDRLPMGLGDFFFNDESPLHPDSDN